MSAFELTIILSAILGTGVLVVCIPPILGLILEVLVDQGKEAEITPDQATNLAVDTGDRG